MFTESNTVEQMILEAVARARTAARGRPMREAPRLGRPSATSCARRAGSTCPPPRSRASPAT